MRRALIAASALTVAVTAVVALPASGAGPRWKTVGPIGVSFRCSFNPCVVGGSGRIRAVGVRLPPKKGGRAKAEWYRTVGRHAPSRMSLTYKGKTIRIPNGAIDRWEEVEPVIEYLFGFNVKQPNGSPFLKTGVGTGTLRFSTLATGAVSMRVPLKITQRD